MPSLETPMKPRQPTVAPRGLQRRSLIGAAAGAGLLAAWPPAGALPQPQDELRVGGTGSGLVPLRRLFEQFGHPARFLPNLGSGGGIKALAAGVIDVALSARHLTEAERGAGLVERELMHTPFVWAAHAGVPVEAMSLRRLADLYGGRVTRWRDGQPVRLILRPESDSDWAYMKSLDAGLAAAMAEAERRPGLKLAITDEESMSDIERIDGALGSTSLALLVATGTTAHMLAVDGQLPSLAALASGRYRFRKTIHWVTRREAPAPAAEVLRLLGEPAGIEALARLGCQGVPET